MKKQFLFTLAVLMICGCSDSGDEIDQQNPKEDTIELSQTTLSFDGSEEKQSIYVHSNRDWTLTGGESWCTPSQFNGDDGDEVTFMVMDNNDGEPRKAKFYFNCGSASKTLTVEQQRGRIIISPSKIEVDIMGGEISVKYLKFKSKMQIADDCKNWITAKEYYSKETIFDIEQNKSKTPREGKITYFFQDVYGGPEFSETVTVYQAGANLDITVNVSQKGKLAETLADYNSAEIGKLKITGELNDEDFITIRNMPNLIDLDISEVNITALPARAFYESTNVENLILPNTLTTIGASMFSESALKSVIIPNGVTTIESHAFDECKALISIEIPASVETIEQWAFCDCSSMKTVTFGKDSRLKKIGTSEYGGSFMRCTALTSIEIPANVETIGPSTFFGCTSLTAIEIPASVTTIGESAFYGCSSLKNIDIPDKVTEIGDSAFRRCSSLMSINIPKEVTEIGRQAFGSCVSLTSINIPKRVTRLEDLFSNCSSLRSVTFEKGSQLKYMVEGVFCDCEALTSIEIPASVEMIDMYYCINLANIYCYPSIPPILNDFRCKNFVLYVPSQSLEAYKNSSWSEYYSSIKTIQ